MEKSNFHHRGTEVTELVFYKRAFLRALCASVVCFGVSRAAAAAEVRFDGSYRLRFNGDSSLPLDETGFASGQKNWAEHRLRLTPKIVEIGENDAIEFQASFDILSGEVAGDVANDFRGYGLTDRSQRTGLRPEGFDFRYLFTQIRTRVGLYLARRVQAFAASGGDLHIWVFDAHLRHSQEVQGLVLSVEGEAAQIYGGTSHAPNLSAPGTTRVSQQGAALRAGVARGQ